MTQACDLGDAPSCKAIDRPIDARVLCTAHEFKACLALGCAGDDTAARVAIANLSDRESCDSNRIPAVPTGIVPVAHLPFDSVEFRLTDHATA